MSMQLLVDKDDEKYIHKYDIPHLANTYCALCILLMLGDDLSKVKAPQLLNSLKYYQLPEGQMC
jgi:prenyltransferase beta subunit